jgi:hypothetical protein
MHTDKQFNAATIERLAQQSGLLLKTYRAEFARDPDSQATKSSRSNLIALLHTIHQVYGASNISLGVGSSDLLAELDGNWGPALEAI